MISQVISGSIMILELVLGQTQMLMMSGYNVFQIVPILNWLQMVFVTMNQIMQTAILMVVIVPQTHLPQPKLQLQELVVPQQLEDALAPLHGLVMHIVMMSITTWTAVMMVETVVDVTLTHNTAQYVHALIQMEAGVGQRARKQQQAQQQA